MKKTIGNERPRAKSQNGRASRIETAAATAGAGAAEGFAPSEGPIQDIDE